MNTQSVEKVMKLSFKLFYILSTKITELYCFQGQKPICYIAGVFPATACPFIG